MANTTVQWSRDIDTALDRAECEHRPILVDFTAAPA